MIFSLKILLTLTLISELIMSKETFLSMLRKGRNGNEILTILDIISGSDDTDSVQFEPTLEEIDF